MKVAKQRVLLTGASGFIGRQVLASLQSPELDIFATSRADLPQNATARVVPLKLDLLSRPDFGKVLEDVRPDLVVHLAWNVEQGLFWNSLENLAWVSATLELARACCKTSVRRFVGVGTCYEYDWPASGSCVEGKTPIKTHSLYDRSKTATRDLLSDAFEKSSLEFAWARVFFLYGPYEGRERLVSSVATSLLSGRQADCSSGLSIRDYMDVRDVGAAIGALAQSSVLGDVNIAGGVGYRVSEIVQTIGDLCGRPTYVRLGAIQDRPEPPHIVGCNRRLTQEVGFRAKFDLATGLKNAVDFWRLQLAKSASHATSWIKAAK